MFFSPIVTAQTILVLGDSLSAAHNMAPEQGWVFLLDKRLKSHSNSTAAAHNIINASISGDTTASGLARLPLALTTHQPDIVILALGANDGLRGLSLTRMQQNLAQMIELSKIRGVQIVLAGMQLPPNYGPVYNNKFKAIYSDIASTYEVSLIPFLLHQVGGEKGLTQADGLHPSAKAQPIILENVWPHLQAVLESAIYRVSRFWHSVPMTAYAVYR